LRADSASHESLPSANSKSRHHSAGISA
jgi:hypothetical protein